MNLVYLYVFQRCAELLRINLVFAIKKTLHAVEQNREDVKTKRDAWKASQLEMDINKLIFLDESGVNTGMTRLYGRCSSNERIIDYIPDVRFERTSIVSSIRVNLRKSKPRTNELLKSAIAEALGNVTTSDILAWFAENGYSTH